MQMPDTDNIHFQYAFKKGYRMAIDGKTMLSMPSNVRRDLQMRDYFQQGWEQAVEDMTEMQETQNQPQWRQRFIWLFFMLLAGAATAYLMIQNIESEKAAQQGLLQPETTPSVEFQTKKNKNEVIAPETNQLSLLTSHQRKDLQQNQAQLAPLDKLTLEEITNSSITVIDSSISERIIDRTPSKSLGNFVPKYIRKVSFYTELQSEKEQQIYHRWRTETQVLATIELTIKKGKFRTWSSKKLSSAWQGKWFVEILDSNKHVIYRQSFNYGIPQNER